MVIKRINNLDSRYWVVRRTKRDTAPYFALFISGKPSWSKFLWMARQHDTQKDAAETIILIRQAENKRKRATHNATPNQHP